MRAYALLGGPENVWPADIQKRLNKEKKVGSLLIGVDRGSLLLEEMGLVPDLAIGDFDSLRPEELSKIEANVHDIRYSNPIKDWTDSELMIRAAFIDYHVDQLTILGATGGRIDHFLVNLFMLLNPAVRCYAEKISLVDCQNKIIFLDHGQHLVQRQGEYPYFGVACLEKTENLNILDARYELHGFSTAYPRIFASNEFKKGNNRFHLNLSSGMAAVIFSKDINRFHNIYDENV